MNQTRGPIPMWIPVRFPSLILVLGIVVAMAGCLMDNNDIKGVQGTGTVRYQSLEGGFYAIIGDDGKNYDPINLPEDLRKEGLRIRFRAKARPDMASVHMWGTIIELKQVDPLP